MKKRLIKWIAENFDPAPVLNQIEQEYGVGVRVMIIVLGVLLGVIVYGYVISDILEWFGP